ncbi:MAG: hypothetical protein JO353_12600 [Phycisphaerae bacterium]|nr:hypothetical protein [Phycisphaerae bacterium]
MTLGSHEFARRAGRQIELNGQPLRIRIGPVETRSADSHDLQMTLQCTVMTRPQSADRQLLAEVLLRDRATVTLADVAEYLTAPLRSAAASTADQPGSTSMSDSGRAALLDRIAPEIDAAAFAAGFVVLPPFHLDVRSNSLEQQSRDAAERARLAVRAAGQLEQVRHATDVLRQFQALRADAPDVSAGEVLERIAAVDRVGVLQSTLAASAAVAQPAMIIAVAGTQWITISASDSPELHAIPDTLGPVRSVRLASVDNQPRLLLGARNGVWLIDPAGTSDPESFAVPTLQSQLGFNAAVLRSDGKLFATHGEAGLLSWQRGEKDFTAVRQNDLSAGGVAPRALLPLDERRIIFAAGAIIFVIDEGFTRIQSISTRSIVNLLPAGQSILVVHDDGAVASLNRRSLMVEPIAHFSGGVVAAGVLPWVDGVRLLLAREAGAIECVGLNDSVVTRYYSPFAGSPRSLSATESLIVGISNDRQRILGWNPADGHAPTLDVHIPSLTKHRAADVITTIL